LQAKIVQEKSQIRDEHGFFHVQARRYFFA